MDHEATASEVEGSAVPDVRNTLQKRSASIFSLLRKHTAKAQLKRSRVGRILLSNSRAFRILMTGSLISMFGSRIAMIAFPMLVLRIEDSPFITGLVAFPIIALSMLLYKPAGVPVDRWNPQRVMLISELLRGFVIAPVDVRDGPATMNAAPPGFSWSDLNLLLRAEWSRSSPGSSYADSQLSVLDRPDGFGFWLGSAAAFVAVGSVCIAIALAEYRPPWPSAWFIAGATVTAIVRAMNEGNLSNVHHAFNLGKNWEDNLQRLAMLKGQGVLYDALRDAHAVIASMRRIPRRPSTQSASLHNLPHALKTVQRAEKAIIRELAKLG
jgi:hypothetical protein